jgi:hypothetical protein
MKIYVEVDILRASLCPLPKAKAFLDVLLPPCTHPRQPTSGAGLATPPREQTVQQLLPNPIPVRRTLPPTQDPLVVAPLLTSTIPPGLASNQATQDSKAQAGFTPSPLRASSSLVTVRRGSWLQDSQTQQANLEW